MTLPGGGDISKVYDSYLRANARKEMAMKCDGLQYPCDNEATTRVVLAFQPEQTPAVTATELCDECYALWLSWQPNEGLSDEEMNVLRNKATQELNLYRREQSTRV